MKVGDLVLWRPDGDIGIIIEIGEDIVKVWFGKSGMDWIWDNPCRDPQKDALEVISENR